VEGKVRLGRKTKDLIPKLRSKEIAVISHEDLDGMGATGLVDSGVCAVVNAHCSMTGRYPNLGPKYLNEHGVVLLDNVGEEIFELLSDGDLVEIRGRQLLREGSVVATGTLVTEHMIGEYMRFAHQNIGQEMARFIDNTIMYAQKEKELILGEISFPELSFSIQGRQVVVVVRGLGYQEDLQILASFVEETKPILLAVDGGADGLLNFGLKPHAIIGDMDSVSDTALRCGAEIIGHAYVNGDCPGKKRLDKLGLDYHVVPALGTSEDLALLLAHQKGAELIILVGSHSNMIDFLEKGRKGMASTFLTRLKIGPILLDAKGVSKLYKGDSSISVLSVVIAALIPIVVFVGLASPWRQYFRLLWLQLRLLVGWL
jgi:uncharacterized membrane-anchored protein